MDDRGLVDGCIAGAPEAWDAFVRLHTTTLEQAIRTTLRQHGVVPDPGRVQELLQNLLGSLVRPEDRTLRDFRWTCSLPYYLTAVASRFCLSHFKERRLEKDLLDLERLAEALASPQAVPAEALQREETREKVRRALLELSERERLAVQFAYWDALPAETAGRLMKVSREGFWQLLERARQKLKPVLQRRISR